jgi:hypothetical protein
MKRRSSGVAEWACGISDLMFAQLPLALREEEGVQELQEFRSCRMDLRNFGFDVCPLLPLALHAS